MKNQSKQEYIPHVGDHLWRLVKVASSGGLFLSLFGTGIMWAGTEELSSSPLVWKISLILNFVFFVAIWITYIPVRKTDRLVGNGLLSMFILLSLFWVVGLAMFYFYFVFAQMNDWVRAVILSGVSAALAYRGFVISKDIKQAFASKKTLLPRMYVDEGNSFSFTRDAVGLLEKARPERSPFKEWHGWAAILLAPFTFVLNRLLTPLAGAGHGIFLVLAFLTVPLMLWGVGIFVQTVVIMIYYPMRFERETGKPVLMKDW